MPEPAFGPGRYYNFDAYAAAKKYGPPDNTPELPTCTHCGRDIKLGEPLFALGIGKVTEGRRQFDGELMDYEDDCGDDLSQSCSRKCLLALIKTRLPK